MVATSNLTCSSCTRPIQYDCVSLSLLPLPFLIPLSLPHSALISVVPPPAPFLSPLSGSHVAQPDLKLTMELRMNLNPILLALPVCAALRPQACAIRPGLFGVGDGTQGFREHRAGRLQADLSPA